jgi:hypothetical protein
MYIKVPDIYKGPRKVPRGPLYRCMMIPSHRSWSMIPCRRYHPIMTTRRVSSPRLLRLPLSLTLSLSSSRSLPLSLSRGGTRRVSFRLVDDTMSPIHHIMTIVSGASHRCMMIPSICSTGHCCSDTGQQYRAATGCPSRYQSSHVLYSRRVVSSYSGMMVDCFSVSIAALIAAPPIHRCSELLL